jgi:acetolactate synthase-1/2/3 large subunit
VELCGADIVIQILIEQGIDVVFGYPGGTVIDIYDSLYKSADRVRHVLVAHEQGAAHAADGYARVTGKPGVCIATSGPGATNLVTGIATSFLDSTPLVAITGNVSWSQIGTDSFQEIDITGITLPVTKHNYFIGDVKDIAPTLREAFRLAQSGRPGPVLVDIAKDAQRAVCEFEPEAAPQEPDVKSGYMGPYLQEVADCINKSSRPFVYCGGGALAAGAEAEIEALADLIDAPIATSLMGITCISSKNPRLLGMEGMHGNYAATKAMVAADCILALGVRFNDRSTGDRATFAKGTRIIHIDIDESELSKTIQDTYDLHGDLKLTLEALLPLLHKQTHPDWDAHIADLRAHEASLRDRREGLVPQNIMASLNARKGDAIVVTDVGQHQMWAAQELDFDRQRSFVTNGGLGAMGFGLGAALGAALASHTYVILVIGDGGLSMCIGELATAVSSGASLCVLLLNNGVLGMVRQQQRFICDGRYSNTDLINHTDFVTVARGFGAHAERVASIEELDQALADARKRAGVSLIECPCDKDELVLPMMLPGSTLDDLITKEDLS